MSRDFFLLFVTHMLTMRREMVHGRPINIDNLNSFSFFPLDILVNGLIVINYLIGLILIVIIYE